MRYLISFFFFSVYIYGFNYHLKPYKISDGIHCFFGLPSQVSHINGGNMINSCYVETSEGYLVIDSGPTYTYAQEAYEVMKKKKKLPVKYVINTSWDEVHVLGNEFYKELGATLLGPKGYKNHIEEKEELFLAKKLSKDAFVNTRVVTLDNYIDKETILVFDKMKVIIKSLKDDNHLYVYIEDKKIVFAGDLVFNNRITPLNNGRSILKWLKDLDELSQLNWQDIISSHGYMTRRSALKNTTTYLSLLKNEVLERIDKGETSKEVIKQVKLLSFSEDRFYKAWHFKNVAKVYEELKESLGKDKLTIENNILIKKDNSIKLIEDSKMQNLTLVKSKLKPKTVEKKIVVKKSTTLKYRNFISAIETAKVKKKIVFIKVRSTVCKYCDQLDRVITKNAKVKNILNKYFEVVKINSDDESIPLSLTVRSTPTLIFVRPDNKKVLMQLSGIRALGELLEILNEAVSDGHNDGYLRK